MGPAISGLDLKQPGKIQGNMYIPVKLLLDTSLEISGFYIKLNPIAMISCHHIPLEEDFYSSLSPQTFAKHLLWGRIQQWTRTDVVPALMGLTFYSSKGRHAETKHTLVFSCSNAMKKKMQLIRASWESHHPGERWWWSSLGCRGTG